MKKQTIHARMSETARPRHVIALTLSLLCLPLAAGLIGCEEGADPVMLHSGTSQAIVSGDHSNLAQVGATTLEDAVAGELAEVDTSVQVTLLRGSCADGDGTACHELGNRYHGGRGVERDNPRAVEFVQRACRLGEAIACHDMGARHYLGIDVEEDFERAQDYFDAGCVGGAAESCYMLGEVARLGLVGHADPTLAQAYYERACSHGVAEACSAAYAELWTGGDMEAALTDASAPVDDELIRVARMCDNGLMSGCLTLSRAHRAAGDEGGAIAAAGIACDWGLLEACVELEEMGAR